MPDGYCISRRKSVILTLLPDAPEEDRIIVIGAMLELSKAAIRRDDESVAVYWLTRAAKLLAP